MNNIFYDGGSLLSYQEFYKLCFGIRGRGKTTKYIVQCVRDFLNGKGKFMYVRRHKSEHEDIFTIFNNAINLNNKRKHPWWNKNTTFEVKGSTRKGGGQFFIDGKLAGRWVTLSISDSYKSGVFDDYITILFDEFIMKKGNRRYLDDEVSTLEDLVETVFRHRDSPNMRGVIMLANKISWYNPYFLAWKITPFKGRFYRDKERSIIAEQDYSKEFAEMKYTTRFGQHLRNTKYGNYSIENETLVQNSKFIEKRSPKSRHYFNVKYMGKTYGAWIDINENKLYLSEKFDGFSKLEYALTTSDHSLNTYYIKNKRNCFLWELVNYYEQGRLFAENEMVDSALQEILQLLL